MTRGVILAGGRGQRMGRDKASVPFRGVAMLEHVATALSEAGLQPLVVGKPTDRYQSIPDREGLGGGPAIGLFTGLEHTGGDVFLVAVDQPLLRPATVKALLELPGDAVVPMAAGHPQVTCAVYRASALAAISQAIAGGERKLRRLLDHVSATEVTEDTWAAWGEDGRSWLSLDTPEAVRKAEALR